jgi:hypothetical protein
MAIATLVLAGGYDLFGRNNGLRIAAAVPIVRALRWSMWYGLAPGKGPTRQVTSAVREKPGRRRVPIRSL